MSDAAHHITTDYARRLAEGLRGDRPHLAEAAWVLEALAKERDALMPRPA